MEKLLAVRLSISSQLAELNGLMIAVGRALTENGYNLVYGGGSSGLMGIVSDTVLEAGGNVTGIMPFAMSSGEGETNPASEVTNDPAARRGKVGHPPSLVPSSDGCAVTYCEEYFKAFRFALI